MSNVISFVDKINSKNGKNLEGCEIEQLYQREISVKIKVYPKELQIVLKLINNEIKGLNREISNSIKYNQKNKITYLSNLLDIFEKLKDIIINSKNMNFINELSFEELDCFLGVIELKLQEYELLEMQRITGVDVTEIEKLMELHKHIIPIYEYKKASI